MITQSGTIKVETPVNERLQKEYLRRLTVICLVCIIIGSAGIVLYVVLGVLSGLGMVNAPSFVPLIAGAFALGFGLIILISSKMAVNKACSENKTEVYEFFSDHVIIQDFVNGENISQAKVYYNRIVNRRETGNYLFFFINANAACPVSKADMSQEELNYVRSLLGFKKVGGGKNLVADGEDKEKNQSEK